MDFESCAAVYDAGRDRRASVRIISAFDLEKQIGTDGGTWLGRRVAMPDALNFAPSEFGEQVCEAMPTLSPEKGGFSKALGLLNFDLSGRSA